MMDVFVHESAVVESENIGDGTRIWAGAHVMPNVYIGNNCNLGENVFVESGVVIGSGVTVKNGVSLWSGVTLEDDVFVGPEACFTNDICPRAYIKMSQKDYIVPTIIKKGASLGANSTVVCGNDIGEYAFVGAGAVVVNDVWSFQLVAGNPARGIGYVCYCGKKLPETLVCGCGRKYALGLSGQLSCL